MALNFEIGRVELSDDTPSGPVVMIDPSGHAVMPEGAALHRAEFRRAGDDLFVVWPGSPEVRVIEYFSAKAPADLLFPEGMRVAGPLALQLADPRPRPGARPVAAVTSVLRSCKVVRPEGRSALNPEQPLLPGDILETGANSGIAIRLADRSLIALGEHARLGIHILDPTSFSLLHGVSIVASPPKGKGVVLDTSVATIRVQAARSGVEIADGHNATVVSLGGDEEITVTNGRGSRVLADANLFTTITSYAQEPSTIGSIDVGDAEAMFAEPMARIGMKRAKPQPEPESKAQAKPVAQGKPAAQAKPVAKTPAKQVAKAQAKPATKAQPKPAAKAQAKPRLKAQAKPGAKAQAKPRLNAQNKPISNTQAKPETKQAVNQKARSAPQVSAQLTPKAKSEAKTAAKVASASQPAVPAKAPPPPKPAAKPPTQRSVPIAEPPKGEATQQKKEKPNGEGDWTGYFVTSGREAVRHGGIGTDFLYGGAKDEVLTSGPEAGAKVSAGNAITKTPGGQTTRS